MAMRYMTPFREGRLPRRQMAVTLGPLIVFLLTCPCGLQANPVMVDGQSLIAFGIVAFWALIVESGIATIAIFSSGVLVVPSFITLVAANGMLFLFGFLPLTDRVSLWILEPGVVLGDALIIRILTCAPFLQGGDFIGVSWRRSLVASLLGNLASFFIGVIGSRAPWIVHDMGT